MDGIVAGLILVVVLVLQSALERLVADHRLVFPFRIRLPEDDRIRSEPARSEVGQP
jgi:hypothetical protein